MFDGCFGVVLRLLEGCFWGCFEGCCLRVGFEKNREAAIGLGEEDEMRASNESRSVIDDHN